MFSSFGFGPFGFGAIGFSEFEFSTFGFSGFGLRIFRFRVFSLALPALMALVSLPTMAAEPPDMPPRESKPSPEQFIETWAEIKYCQDAYKRIENRSRVYPYDTEQCSAADQALAQKVQQFPADTRSRIDTAVAQRKNVIIANTRDVTLVLNACRDACGKLVQPQNQQGQ